MHIPCHKFRFGLIGFGHWGSNLARNANNHQSGQLVAIADTNPKNLSRASILYPGVAFFTDAERLIASGSIDAVIITSPAGSHFKFATLAMEAGLHVLVTKPLALDYRQALALHHLARSQGLALLIDHTFVYTAAFSRIKELLASGVLGSCLYYDSVRTGLGIFKVDADIITDLAIHDIAIVTHLFEEQPYCVSAISRESVAGQLPSLTYINIFYRSGLNVHIAASWLSPLKQRQIVLAGSDRIVVWDDSLGSSGLSIYDCGVTPALEGEIEGRAKLAYRTGERVALSLASEEALHREIDDFIRCMAAGEIPISNSHSACKVMKMVDAAQCSTQLMGEPVLIDWNS